MLEGRQRVALSRYLSRILGARNEKLVDKSTLFDGLTIWRNAEDPDDAKDSHDAEDSDDADDSPRANQQNVNMNSNALEAIQQIIRTPKAG